MGIVTLDEADKKKEYARILMRQGRADRTEIENADPRFRYRLGHSRERQVRHNKANGFEVVPHDDPAQLRYGEKDTLNNSQKLGEDLILMREPRDLYEAKVRQNEAEAKRREGVINAEAREKIEQIARDEGRAPAHKSVTFDNSRTGDPVEVRVPGKPKN